MDALIVGAGAVGRWFADLLDSPVAFADVDAGAAEAAAAAVGDRGSIASRDGEDTFDVVVVAVPMRAATETIREQGHRADEALVDLTGSMVAPLAAMEAAAPDCERASFHPLFAPAHAPGRVAFSEGSTGPTVDAIRERLAARGNEVVPVDPGVHDEAMETIQGRAHAAILAFGLAAEDVPAELATPVFEDLQALRDRVTGGSPGVYADIQSTFDGAADIATAARRLADADRDTFEALYDDAG
jgi:prephenate dehydrogenase